MSNKPAHTNNQINKVMSMKRAKFIEEKDTKSEKLSIFTYTTVSYLSPKDWAKPLDKSVSVIQSYNVSTKVGR